MGNDSSDHNRFKITGTINRIYDLDVKNESFRKREFSIRFSDINFFNNKVIERVIKFSLLNEKTKIAEEMNIDDQVEVSFYIDGRDYTNKAGIENNFTSLAAIDVEWVFKAKPKNESADTGDIFKRKENQDMEDVLSSIDDEFDVLSNPEKALEAEKEKEKSIDAISNSTTKEQQDNNLDNFEDLPF